MEAEFSLQAMAKAMKKAAAPAMKAMRRKKAVATLAKAKWTFAALTGTEKEALAAERELGAHMAKAYLEEVPLAVDSELQG